MVTFPESTSDRPMVTGHFVDDDPHRIWGLAWAAARLEEDIGQPARKRSLLFLGPSRKHLYVDHRHVVDDRQRVASS